MDAVAFYCHKPLQDAHQQIRGKNAFEIYKNFVTNESNFILLNSINSYFVRSKDFELKDDLKSQQFRKEGNEDYKNGNYKQSAVIYTKSLCYATYNGEAYATTLANRSAAFFKLEDYESCIKDIDLCLKADYPEALRPKICIRKAECYQKLGDSLKMRNVLLDVLNVIDSMELSLKPIAENYRKVVKELITEEADTKKDETNRFDELPILDANPSFLGASTAIELQHTKCGDARVVAKKEIAPGDILFVEKAYAFVSWYDNKMFPIHCQNCLKTAASCVPCNKGCVAHLYCSEECRDAAWNDGHQWECKAIQAGILDITEICPIMCPMSLQVLFKGLQTGLPMNDVHFENGIINNYGNIDDNYPYMFSLPAYIEKVTDESLEKLATAAEIFVIYLIVETNFFDHLKKWPAYANKSDKELTHTIGGLLLKHMVQLYWSRIKIPYFDLSPIKNVTVGFAVCPSLAMATHSCEPNTTHYFVGDTVVVKAIENIKPNEEIHHAYGNYPPTEMQKCPMIWKCQPCNNPKMSRRPHNAYICSKCNGTLIIESRSRTVVVGTCLDCNSQSHLSPEVINKERSVLQILQEFDKFNDLQDANLGLQLAKTIYHPCHKVIRGFYHAFAKYYLRTGNSKGNMEMQKVLIEYYDKYYGNLSLQSGAVRFTYCCIYLKWLKEDLMNRYLQAGEILEELKNTIEKVKVIMYLHFPPVLEKVAELEKLILELQVMDIITQEVYNMRLDCF